MPQTTQSLLSNLQRRLQRTLPDARLEITHPPGLTDLRLALINGNFPTGPLPVEVMRAVIAEPAYWAFCWGSGLALAQFLLAEPDWVASRTVVDLGAGSGVVAIAAAQCGAARVWACDTDPDALAATRANAALNGVDLHLTTTLPDQCDLIVMADVLYDRSNLPLLELAQSRAQQVLVADSRVTTLPDRRYAEIARIDSLTYPNLGEFDEFRTAHLFHWRA